MLRPNVAISECAQTMQDNMETCTIFSNEVKQSLVTKLAPLQETFNHLNSNDKTTTATPQDIFNVMSFAIDRDDQFDNELAEMMHSASAMYVAAVQMRAMRAMMTHIETYANKIASDEPSVIAFKNTGTMQALQTMLNTVCLPAATALPRVAARNLLGQLVNPNGAQQLNPQVPLPLAVPAAVVPPAIVQPQHAVQPPAHPLVQPGELAEMRRQRQQDTSNETPDELVAQDPNEDEETPSPKKPKKSKKNKKKNRLSALAQDE
ncbi:hypothetical protein AC249_AIPGENE26411 [Exaiptasia diaphana]|nr:hypothetical protein AC249_AIPGENE26411 [Exaiptasia diaphana]